MLYIYNNSILKLIMNNDNNNENSLEEWVIIFTSWNCIIAGVLGVIGNSLTLIVMYGIKQVSKKPITYLIMNLAVTDLLYCLISLPSHYLYITMSPNWWNGNIQKVICSFSVFWRYLNGAVDITSVGVIAIER